MHTTFAIFEATRQTYESAARTAARDRAAHHAIAADGGPGEARRRPRIGAPRVRMPHWPRPASGHVTA